MEKLLNNLTLNSECIDETIKEIENTKVSEYYKRFGSEAERKQVINRLEAALKKFQENRIKIIDSLFEAISDEKSKLIEKVNAAPAG